MSHDGSDISDEDAVLPAVGLLDDLDSDVDFSDEDDPALQEYSEADEEWKRRQEEAKGEVEAEGAGGGGGGEQQSDYTVKSAFWNELKTAAADASCPVSKDAGAMAKTRGEDRTGLGGFEAAAKASADNAAYREAQWSVATDLYWKFAVDYCAKKGRSTGRPGPVMKSPLAIGAMYDTALNHGPNGFGKIEKGMADATSGPEGRWITDFEESRYRLLKSGYQDLDTSGTGARARIWQQLVKEGNWDLKRPINVYKGNGAYWGAQVIR